STMPVLSKTEISARRTGTRSGAGMFFAETAMSDPRGRLLAYRTGPSQIKRREAAGSHRPRDAVRADELPLHFLQLPRLEMQYDLPTAAGTGNGSEEDRFLHYRHDAVRRENPCIRGVTRQDEQALVVAIELDVGMKMETNGDGDRLIGRFAARPKEAVGAAQYRAILHQHELAFVHEAEARNIAVVACHEAKLAGEIDAPAFHLARSADQRRADPVVPA